MKKLLLLLNTLLIVVTANAGHITEEQALLKARKFMGARQIEASPSPAKDESGPSDSQPYYIFNAQEGEGFVIVAGDDSMPEILGYSASGRIDVSSLPEGLRWLLDSYAKTYDQLNATGTTLTSQRANAAGKSDIPALVKTTWGQGAPYNAMCPLKGPNENYMTGCVATALAQVINYHQWPKEETAAVAEYTTERDKIYMPELLPFKFDWDNMTDALIARLMLYCGQSLKMDYGLDESGANAGQIPDVVRNIFGYSIVAKNVIRDNYDDAEWADLMYDELAEGRPIIYSGYGYGGGHCFIVDGYTNGLFHVNWGWNGDADGYFKLGDMLGYDWSQMAIIGIRPPKADDPTTVDDPEDEGFRSLGTKSVDGVSYLFYSVYGQQGARIIQEMETGKYSGDIYVPDSVSFNGRIFPVKDMDLGPAPFDGCDGLTSLSISLPENFNIENCPNLTTLELREGMTRYNAIANLKSLKELEFPRTLSTYYPLNSMESLKSIKFNYPAKISFVGDDPFPATDMPQLSDVYFLSDEPSTTPSGSPFVLNPNVTIHIPEGSMEAYAHSA